MSDEIDRIKHSKRLHSDQVKSRRQARIAKSAGVDVKSEHLYNKMHAMNCGNPKCFMCGNPRKMFGEETIQERRLAQREHHTVERDEDLFNILSELKDFQLQPEDNWKLYQETHMELDVVDPETYLKYTNTR